MRASAILSHWIIFSCVVIFYDIRTIHYNNVQERFPSVQENEESRFENNLNNIALPRVLRIKYAQGRET